MTEYEMALAKAAFKKPSPTKAQVATVLGAIESRPEAEIVAWMDEDERDEMVMCMTEDGLTTTAWFGRDGVIIGDWL